MSFGLNFINNNIHQYIKKDIALEGNHIFLKTTSVLEINKKNVYKRENRGKAHAQLNIQSLIYQNINSLMPAINLYGTYCIYCASLKNSVYPLVSVLLQLQMLIVCVSILKYYFGYVKN